MKYTFTYSWKGANIILYPSIKIYKKENEEIYWWNETNILYEALLLTNLAEIRKIVKFSKKYYTSIKEEDWRIIAVK